jgi:hypothetical protein
MTESEILSKRLFKKFTIPLILREINNDIYVLNFNNNVVKIQEIKELTEKSLYIFKEIKTKYYVNKYPEESQLINDDYCDDIYELILLLISDYIGMELIEIIKDLKKK